MNVVRHHHKRVEMITPPISIVNGIHYHPGDIGHAQEEWAGARAVQQTVHATNALPEGIAEGKLRPREAPMQAPREEAGLAYRVVVRQAAAGGKCHEQNVGLCPDFSRSARPIANRPQVANLPHIKT